MKLAPSFLAALLAVCLGCHSAEETSSSGPQPAASQDQAAQERANAGLLVRIDEQFESTPPEPDTLDAMEFWPGGDGRWWLIVAAKRHDQLNIYDASSGQLIRRVGESGSGRGQFARPHELVVVDDLLFVCERDNTRVQVLRLPDMDSLGWFGADQLRRPYGLAVVRSADGASLEVFVGDNYRPAAGESPDLTERVKHFRVQVRRRSVVAEHVRSFGAPNGDGALYGIDAIIADPDWRRLLIADGVRGNVRLYSLEGDFQSLLRVSGQSEFQPKSFAFLDCAGEEYLISVEDAFVRSAFRVFDRETLQPLGEFMGRSAANSDGLAVAQTPIPNFPRGAIYATNDDETVVGFSWADLASALALRSDCHEPGT